MPESFRAPIGTQDVLPPESARWQRLIATFAGVAERLGVGTEVVRKEMYDFRDKGDRHLALRPDATASVARAYVQHRPPTPWKVWCLTPAWRYERPQAGRLRQHHQVDVEAIGVADPDLDVEVIALGAAYLQALGLRRWRLVLNTMGTPADRVAYGETLTAWLRERAADLAPEDREKIDGHPLRVLDSKRPETRAAVADAPRMADVLDDASRRHFERVQDGLRSLRIPYEVEPGLVRGLDYYTHTLFEFQSDALDTTLELRAAGLRADRAFDGRSMKAQMKAAGRSGAPVAVIVGAQEATDGTATVRDLTQGEQKVVGRDRVVDVVHELLASGRPEEPRK